MDREEILERLTEHGTRDQVQWFNNLDPEIFLEVFFSIISENKAKNKSVNSAAKDIGEFLDKSEYSEYVLYRAMYLLLDSMRKIMPAFKDDLGGVPTVEAAYEIITEGAKIRTVKEIVAASMQIEINSPNN